MMKWVPSRSFLRMNHVAGNASRGPAIVAWGVGEIAQRDRWVGPLRRPAVRRWQSAQPPRAMSSSLGGSTGSECETQHHGGCRSRAGRQGRGCEQFVVGAGSGAGHWRHHHVSWSLGKLGPHLSRRVWQGKSRWGVEALHGTAQIKSARSQQIIRTAGCSIEVVPSNQPPRAPCRAPAAFDQSSQPVLAPVSEQTAGPPTVMLYRLYPARSGRPQKQA